MRPTGAVGRSPTACPRQRTIICVGHTLTVGIIFRVVNLLNGRCKFGRGYISWAAHLKMRGLGAILGHGIATVNVLFAHVLLLELSLGILFLCLFALFLAKPFLEIVCNRVDDLLKLCIAGIFCALNAFDGVSLDVGH